MMLDYAFLETPTGFQPLLCIGVPAGVRNYVRKKARESLAANHVRRYRLHELDELEGLGLAGGIAVDLA